MLKIKDLKIEVGNKTILQNVNLEFAAGEIVSLSGPNGSGKSTLAQALIGNPEYNCNGKVIFKKQNLLKLEPSERSNSGLFVSFQHPTEIPGVSLVTYLKEIINSKREFDQLPKLTAKEILEKIKGVLKLLDWDESFLKRNLNEGMSGGEKKKSEILQMLLLDPDFVVLDEIDSGLDSKALEVICSAIKSFVTKQKTLVIISHNQKIFELLKPNRILKVENSTIKEV
jgi:Fe-S cluster assembly ATP-binding protein